MDYSSNRRQEVLSLARKIIADKDSYPEVMQTTADNYLNMDTQRRQSVLFLWRHKQIRKLYRDSGGFSKKESDRRKAGNIIRCSYREISNDFHKAKNAMYSKYNWSGISVVEFLAMNTLLECNDLENINKYFRCVNAMRYDESLIPVAFLRPLRQTVVIELLSFKSLQEQKKQTLTT